MYVTFEEQCDAPRQALAAAVRFNLKPQACTESLTNHSAPMPASCRTFNAGLLRDELICNEVCYSSLRAQRH